MSTTSISNGSVGPRTDGSIGSDAPAATSGPDAGPTAAAPTTERRDRRRLGEILVDAGVLDEDQLIAALEDSSPDERLGATLQRLGYATDQEIAVALATQLRLPYADPVNEPPAPEAIALLPGRLAERHGVLPLRLDGGRLVVATADPADLVALDDVRTAAGVRSLEPVVATASAIDRSRRRAYRQDQAGEALEELDAEAETVDPAEFETDPASIDQPVVRLVDGLLADAITARASDVHVEPHKDGITVRMRVDGLLREVRELPRALGRQVVSRLKIMGRLDIAERRLPQDGRAVARVDHEEVDLRISTMPTMYGETVVLRLLPRGAERLELDQLGLPASARSALTTALGRPQGLVLVTGPTGSGKTSTLYASLAAVTDPTRNVLTLEDPVEVQLPGVNQTQVEPRIGLTFARGLRHVLRQDPDVVLVGEIRDQETAALAVEASFTGHLVLATLHTTDAPSAVARLSDLGADPFLVASSLLLVVGQRLARRTCDGCAVADEPEPATLKAAGLSERAMADARFRRGAGCSSCDQSGVRGRTAIGEVLPISGSLRDLIVERAPERALAQQARREHVATLREEAVARAVEGEITLEEALRVTPDPPDEIARCERCDEPVADDHIACGACGHDLLGARCGSCSRSVEATWSTCPWCRAALSG